MTEENKRVPFIDMLKGIAVLLVIIGHTIENGLGGSYTEPEVFYNNPVHILIYSFHMPLFMLISGYLFSISMIKHSFWTNFSNRIRTLVIPDVAWCTTILIIGLVNRIFSSGFSSIMKDTSWFIQWRYNLLHLFWFIWAVLASSVIVMIVHALWKDKLLIYVALLFFMLLLPGKFQEHIFVYPYFIIAYMAGKHNLLTKFCKMAFKVKASALCIVTLLFLWLLRFYEYNTYVYISGVSLTNCGGGYTSVLQKIGLDIYRWGIGLLGSIVMIAFAYALWTVIRKKAIFMPLIICGKYSLQLYCSNPIAVMLVVPFVLRMASPYDMKNIFLIIILEVFLEAAFSCIIAALIERNKVLSLIYTGRLKNGKRTNKHLRRNRNL